MVTLGEIAARKAAMSIRSRTVQKTQQTKIPTDPPPMCARNEKHGASVRGRKDKLCSNCAAFADKAAGKPFPGKKSA
jgi:hypothetical protein